MQRYQVVTQNDIEKIHETSIRILKEIGIVLGYEPARELLAKHGVKIDGKIVFFPKELVEEKLKSAPSEFTLYSRNPARNVEFNTKDAHYVGPGGSAFVMDLDKGRRQSNKEDFIDLVKIFQMLEHFEMHHVPCDMGDVDANIRNKEVAYQMMKYSDKPFMGFMFGYEEAKTCIEMASLPFGGLDAIRNKPVTLCDPCTITPLGYDDKALGALMAFAEYGQVQLINSLCMAGTTAPVTLAGSAAVQNAEILAGIVLAQCVNPGTPVIYSASSSNANMNNGSLTIGSPEATLMSLLNGQLAKLYNLPCRISGAISDSKCVDAQAGYESMMNLMSTEMAGGNFILHGGGILDTYSTVSFEKIIVDHELVGMVKRISRGIDVNENTLAFDVIKDVGPQGEFLSQSHTFKNFKKEHYMPKISDRQSLQWGDEGYVSIEQRANAMWKEILKNYVEPDFPADLDADLQKYLCK